MGERGAGELVGRRGKLRKGRGQQWVGHQQRQTELGKGLWGGIGLGESERWYQESFQSMEWLETGAGGCSQVLRGSNVRVRGLGIILRG